jgi:hypothetical protein
MSGLKKIFGGSVVGMVAGLVMTGVVLAAAPIPGITITAIDGQDATLGAVTLTVPVLPTTVNIDGTATIDKSTLDGAHLTLSDNGTVFYGPVSYWAGIGDMLTASFSAPWTIGSAGTHQIVGTISHGNEDGTDSVDVIVNLNLTVNQCPAAPAIAAAYMQSHGVKSGSAKWKSIINYVSSQTGNGGIFWAAHSCDAGYAAAVQAYVAAHL